MRRVEDPEFQPVRVMNDDDDDEEPQCEWDEAHRPGICLLPHFDYTYNLHEEVSEGRHWEEEHTYILKQVATVLLSFK